MKVFYNLDSYLFQLVFTSYLKHSSSGHVWRRQSPKDYYLIEITSPQIRVKSKTSITNRRSTRSIHSIINYLPAIEFRLPVEYLYFLNNRQSAAEQCYDNVFAQIFSKEKYQRTCFYLKLVHNFRNVNPREDLNKNK